MGPCGSWRTLAFFLASSEALCPNLSHNLVQGPDRVCMVDRRDTNTDEYCMAEEGRRWRVGDSSAAKRQLNKPTMPEINVEY